ncbi:Hypothetical protein, putative [Bodo saltans]|uniref:Uncharacterized protein n=1 Tax=Bodo saltans TaxID=75058 RepID=A0A0S4JFS5_BODSA|nr:Hypothetical protein, putative [Bodo saltans]|eukprot:CUG88994.1 Hypothetical protein, putative [Bodo saltans]
MSRQAHPKTFDEQVLTGRQMPRERISPVAKQPRTQYSREVDIGISTFLANKNEDIDSRPVALTRWAFDDYVSEEMWGDVGDNAEVASSSCGGSDAAIDGKHRVVGAEVISEGIPDSEIILQLQQRLGIRPGARANEDSRVAFASPCDFVSVARRRIYLPQQALKNLAFRDAQLIKNDLGGRAHISRVMPFSSNHQTSSAPRAVRHTFVLRGCAGALSSIFERVQRIQEGQGVANFTDVAQHGYHLHRAFSSGLDLLQRNHVSFFTKYVMELTEGSRSVRQDADRIASLISSPSSGEFRLVSEWKSIEASLRVSIGRAASAASGGNTGLYLPHLKMLQQIVERMIVMPENARADSAKLIRENVSRRVLQDRLRALTNVHFNAWTSLRLNMLPHSVQVGDVVLARRGLGDNIGLLSRLDPCMTTRRDHSFGIGEHLNYVDLASLLPPTAAIECADGVHVRVVSSESEAARFKLDDVVTPLFSYDNSTHATSEDGTEVANASLLFPSHRFGKATYNELAQRLQLASLSSMKLSTPPAYRPIVVRPRNMRCFMVDDVRNVQHGDENLGRETLVDKDGIRRLRSPLSATLGEAMSPPARAGVNTREARSKFIDLALRPGFTAFLQFELPFGSSPNSVLREIVKTKTVDPGAIMATLMAHAKQSGGRRR